MDKIKKITILAVLIASVVVIIRFSPDIYEGIKERQETRERLNIAEQKCDEILDKIPWDDIFNGVSYFIHGDLNFGNILYNKSKDQFRLIDARVDFGGNVEYGDIYYDLAKLYAGLIINFNHIKKNQFQYTRTSDSAEISFESWGMRDSYLEILEKYIVTFHQRILNVS